MKRNLICLILYLVIISCSQSKSNTKKSNVISFVAKVDLKNATTDGIYINGYIVEIDYEKIKKLDKKKVRITGKVVLRKELKKNSLVLQQGRAFDMKHIISPEIKIINN